jgi:putative transcriptional regulator
VADPVIVCPTATPMRRVPKSNASTTSPEDGCPPWAAGEGPDSAVIALGYAGWDAGQLEDEMARNAWLTVDANARVLFSTPVEERWSAAARLLGVDLVSLSSDAGHA